MSAMQENKLESIELPRELPWKSWNLGEISEALELASTEAALRRRDSQVISNPDWFQVITPSQPHTRWNGVVRCQIKDPVGFDEVIEKVISYYRAHSLPFRWEVGPWSSPSALNFQLRKHGLKLATSFLGMALQPDRFVLEASPDIEVELVNETNLDDWVKASVEGWGQSSDTTHFFREDLLRDLEAQPQKLFHFLARWEGKPVGAASLRWIDSPIGRSGYFHNSSVCPEYRKRGVYRSLVSHRLQFLRTHQVHLATTQAIEQGSARICKAIGFETICRLSDYHWTP